MNTKLTLRLDNRLIESAKRHSAQSGKSISRLVGDFFALIDAKDHQRDVTQRVRSLRGVLAGSALDEADYRRHLEEKYR